MLRPHLPVIAFFSVLVVACREPPAPAPTEAPTPSSSARAQQGKPASTLTRVASASHVCMVNDRDMGSDQIPITVDGKTYYGCCASCKDKLQNQASARTALDPVTQNPVDKATAVIARTEAGKVFYFESAATLARYQP